jgi:DNA modification methylase
MQGTILNVAGRSVPATVVPDGDRTPDEWAGYCNAARGKAVESIIEWGNRIQEAHTAYKAEPQRWGQRWDVWCKEQLGNSKSHLSAITSISNAFGSTEHISKLPPQTDSLYALARLKRDAPKAFEQAIKDGTISPAMSRGEAKELLEEHTGAKRIPAQILSDPPPVAGQAWKLGNHLLYCADSSTWRPPLDQPARMAFADPPYGLTSAHWDSELYWEHDWLVDHADFVFVTPGIRNTKRFQPAMPYHWTLTYWMSNSMTHGPVGFSNVQHIELYSRLDSVKVGAGDWFQDAMGSGTVDAAETRNHRGQKPISLLVWLLEKFTEPNDWVIDPFLGSGTTLLAAERTGRCCLGVEKDPDYCQQIIAAWSQMTNQQPEQLELV